MNCSLKSWGRKHHSDMVFQQNPPCRNKFDVQDCQGNTLWCYDQSRKSCMDQNQRWALKGQNFPPWVCDDIVTRLWWGHTFWTTERFIAGENAQILPLISIINNLPKPIQDPQNLTVITLQYPQSLSVTSHAPENVPVISKADNVIRYLYDLGLGYVNNIITSWGEGINAPTPN